MERLKSEEEGEEAVVVRPKRPRAVVVGPTRELTDQALLFLILARCLTKVFVDLACS